MGIVKTEALCIRAYDFSETSQVLHFYARRSGRIQCIAKGAKRPRSRYDGPFDILGLSEILYIEKPPGQLDLLTEATLLESFPRLRHHLIRFGVACYLVEFIERMTPEGACQPALFDDLVRALHEIEGSGGIVPSVLKFECRALRGLGHQPRLQECGICRRKISGDQAYFGALDGGTVCLQCTPRDPYRLMVSRQTLEILSRGEEGDLGVLPVCVRMEVRQVLDLFIRHVAEAGFQTAWYVSVAFRKEEDGMRLSPIELPPS